MSNPSLSHSNSPRAAVVKASSIDRDGTPRLHILVPVHNRRATTLQFVEALAQQSWQDFHLVLIDDGSSDHTADAVREVFPAVDVITGRGDWWWAGSLDAGCRYLARTGVADEDVLLLINDDVRIASDFLREALLELVQSPDTLLLARQVDAATLQPIDHGGGVHADLAELRFASATSAEDINCLPTRGLFLRWRDLRRSGGFRPHRLRHYLSDYEFTIRAQRHGLKLRVAQRAAVGVQTEQTGRALVNLFQAPRGERFRLLFSPRFKDNPVTWSVFAALVASPGRRPYLWLKIWANFVRTAVQCLYRPVEPRRSTATQ